MSARYKVKLPDVRYLTERIPCQMNCPVLTDCGKYVQLIRDGKFEEAYLTARSPNPLASICGRICAAPCEDKCRRGKFDAPVSIRALKRFVTEKYGVESRAPETYHRLEAGEYEPGNKWLWHLPKLAGELSGAGKGRKVAVIGAGPAGVACAHDLVQMGYAVTVFEVSDRAGGMAFHGIPEFRLQRSVLEKEIAAVAEMGAEFRFNSPLSPGRGIASLKAEGYEAVFIGVGVQQGRDMQCPGRDLDGIVRAIEYLININNGYKVPRASRVLVVGGGFVAFDAARMALRAGAADEREIAETGSMSAALDAARIAIRAGAEVTLACLESYAEMPVTRTEQGREEFEDAIHEGIKFLPQRGVKSFAGNGRVAKVNMIGVTRTYDDDGRFSPVYDEAVEQSVDADLVILAIGQQADLSFIRPEDGIELTPGKTIKVERETLATTAPGIYAGGDVAFGPRNLIDAVADGKRAARAINAHLAGDTRTPGFVFRFEKIPTRMYDRADDYDLIRKKAPPTVEIGRRTGISEVEYAYTEAEARDQAERCLECHIQTVYDPKKCVLCNRCVDVCPENCLKLVPLDQIGLSDDDLAAAIEAGGVGPDETLSAMIKDDEVCIRCGLCAIRCPTDAMTMEVMYYEQR